MLYKTPERKILFLNNFVLMAKVHWLHVAHVLRNFFMFYICSIRTDWLGTCTVRVRTLCVRIRIPDTCHSHFKSRHAIYLTSKLYKCENLKKKLLEKFCTSGGVACYCKTTRSRLFGTRIWVGDKALQGRLFIFDFL